LKLKERIKNSINNEKGAGNLEAVVLLAVVVVLCSVLLVWLSGVLDFGRTRNKYSVSTGWFD